MSEKQKTALLYAVVLVCFCVMCSLVVLFAPSPFASYVKEPTIRIENTTTSATQTTHKASDPDVSETDRKIDINTADLDKLMLLDGMTRELAEDVLILRDSVHAFDSFDDLMQIDGITAKMLEKWQKKAVCS